jgi:hypothetical protein
LRVEDTKIVVVPDTSDEEAFLREIAEHREHVVFSRSVALQATHSHLADRTPSTASST